MSDAKQPPAPATASAVAGLAREVEGLRRRLEQLDGLSGRVKDLARTVAQLAGEVAAGTGSINRDPPRSWLDLPDSTEMAGQLLDELIFWVLAVYLRYADAARTLPDCWLWHPDIVEELQWLMQAWMAAYRHDGATVAMAADWHDRYRPGVVRRIKDHLGKSCSLENHAPRDGQRAVVPQPLMDGAARAAIAHWWGTRREQRAPAPTAEQLADTQDSDPTRRRHR